MSDNGGRGKWTKNQYGQDMYIIDEHQSSSKDSSTPTIDKLEGKPLVNTKKKGRCPDDRNLTDMLSGGHV